MPSVRYWRSKIIEREEKIRRLKTMLYWFAFAAAFSAATWSFLASPFFKITNIAIPENDVLTKEDIANLIYNDAPFDLGFNYFLMSKKRLWSEMAAAFPAITKIEINKDLFHDLKINFQKRIQSGLWCPEGALSGQINCYYFDDEGIIFKQSPQTEGALILKVIDGENNSAVLGGRVLDGDLLNFFTELKSQIDKDGKFRIIEYRIKPAANVEIEALTDRGFLIYLDRNSDPGAVASGIFTVINEVIKNRYDSLLYLDARIPTRIFYKLK